jgi:hypothetical protein
MKNGTLTTWMLGALLGLTLVGWGSNYALVVARLGRIEEKVERIQAEYYKIALIEYQVRLLLERSAP